MIANSHTVYDNFSKSPVDYRIIDSSDQLAKIIEDPRYWRIVAFKDAAVEMLRVPMQVDNDELRAIETNFGLRVASGKEVAAAFTSTSGHQYSYPWGDTPDAKNAPYLMRSNPKGMGMNLAGLYFNGPENKADPQKNGLWMVTAEREENGTYFEGRRSGTAYNVGVFEEAAAGERGVLAGERGMLPGERGALAGERAKLAKEQQTEPDFLTPAGIGRGENLRGNEGYVMVRELSNEKIVIYREAMTALGDKISADDGIPLISIGDAAKTSKPIQGEAPIILFGTVGHCLVCPNPASLTIPINAPRIAKAAGIPVLEYPEFADHKVMDGKKMLSPIVPKGSSQDAAGRRLFPILMA